MNKAERDHKRAAKIQALKASDPKRTGDTLEDMGRKDFDNFDHLLKNECKVFYFRDRRACYHFMGHCTSVALKKVGVNMDLAVAEQMQGLSANQKAHFLDQKAPKIIERLQEKMGVRVESRKYEIEADRWKNGLYIFKNDEIAFVIGDNETHYLAGPDQRYSVRTNVPTEDERKIIILPSIMDGRNTPDFLKGKVAADGFGGGVG